MARTKTNERDDGKSISTIPITNRAAEQRNQNKDSSVREVMAIRAQIIIPAIRSTQNIPVKKARTGPGTTSASPPKITPARPFRRQDSFASIELRHCDPVNSFVCTTGVLTHARTRKTLCPLLFPARKGWQRKRLHTGQS